MSSKNAIRKTIKDLESFQVFGGLRVLKQLYRFSIDNDDEHVAASLDEISWYCEILLGQTIAGRQDDFITTALFDWMTEGESTAEEFVCELINNYCKKVLIDAS